MKRKSIDELKEIAKLGRIKNRGKLKKEGLIISILKSEGSNAEPNAMRHFSINTNVSNTNVRNTNVNNNNNNNNNNSDNDDEITGKISDIRIILSRLGNTVTNKDRKKVRRKLCEIEYKKNLLKKRFMTFLLN